MKRLDELQKDNNILEELKDITSESLYLKELLMDNRINKFNPSKIMSNEDLKKYINDLIEKKKINIQQILKLIPKEDKSNKQRDIKLIYESLVMEGKKIEEHIIELEPSFWEKVNEYALKKILNNLKDKKKLYEIDENEDNALLILETLYKYIPPVLEENNELKIVPNQYGDLLNYKEVNEERELNQDFKDMLKNLFGYDISYYLKHKKLKLKIQKELSINEEIIEVIEEGFKENIFNDKEEEKELKQKSKAFIKFYPKKKDNNYVLKFIDCYKSLSGEKFEEQEINTNNIDIWEKAIKTLIKELLKIINQDKEVSKTSKRVNLKEDVILEKLNIFYSILFKFENKNIYKYSIIPNEKGLYKHLVEVFGNKNIDDDIKKVLSFLNEEKSFENILIHNKIHISISYSYKTIEDIASIIDKEIKEKYEKIDLEIQKSKEEEVKIDENIKKACQLLLHKWFKENKDKIKLFEFTKSHLVDISVKILFDKNIKEILEQLLINEPETLIEMINFQNPFAPFFYSDQSFIEENDSSFLSSSDATRDDSVIRGQQNNNIMQFYYYYFQNNRRNNNNNNYNYYWRERFRNNYNEGLRKYCKAQAYVYEKLLTSHLFTDVYWKNKINENEEGELVILANSHRYKVKRSDSSYDFTVKTNQNKQYKISVKIKKYSSNSNIKFTFNYSQWNLFNSETSIIFALVSLNDENNPQIDFTKKINLNEI